MANRDLDLVFNNTTHDTLPCRSLVVRAFAAAKSWLHIPRGHTAELGVQLVGPTRIRTLNRTYRRKDVATDVLSFPLHMRPIQGYTAVSLGDLFICPQRVRAKAAREGRPVRDQMKWTIVHGLLHLAGYNHEKSAVAARRMFVLEQTILKKLVSGN